MSEWRMTTVGDVALQVTKGTTPASSDFTSAGVAYVKVEAIRDDGAIDYKRLSFVHERVHATVLKRSRLQPNDLLFTIAGTIGKAAIVQGSMLPANVNQAVAIIRPDVTRIIPRFLYYALRDRNRLQSAVARTVQSVQSNLSLSELSQLQVPQPPPAEQQAIAEVLGALDDKIAANTALAITADELMLRTFRHCPRDRTVPLSSTAAFVNGRAFTKEASGAGRVVIRIAELNGGVSGSTVFSDAIVDDSHVARPGDILFAWSGSLTLRRWFLDEAIVNQHIFKVIPNSSMPTWLIFELIREKLDDFKAIAADKATTMGHIQRHHLDQPVGLPDAEQIAAMDPLMSGLWSSALNAERESLTLAATRDALLPQLMSGKLRVRDAEKIAAEAGA